MFFAEARPGAGPFPSPASPLGGRRPAQRWMVRLNRVANVSVARTLGNETCFVDALDIDSLQKRLKVGRWLVVDQE